MADAARQSTVLKGSFSAPEEFWGFAQQETDDSVSFVSPREWERHNCPLEYQGWRLLPPLTFKPPFPLTQEAEIVLKCALPESWPARVREASPVFQGKEAVPSEVCGCGLPCHSERAFQTCRGSWGFKQANALPADTECILWLNVPVFPTNKPAAWCD